MKISISNDPNLLDSLDIYLKKDDQIIGLHAIGYAGPYEYTYTDIDGNVTQKTSNFQALDTWGNNYNNKYEMFAPGSFRIDTNDLEEESRLYAGAGWIEFDRDDKTMEVHGKLYKYTTCNLDVNDVAYSIEHNRLISEGYWLGTQADNVMGYCKLLGEVK